MTRAHEPISSDPTLPSPDKRTWCHRMWNLRGPKQPWFAVFQYAMNSTMRPSAPDETIAYGYVTLNKFHDREPQIVLKAIEEVDPHYFDDFPRKPTTVLDEDFKCAIIGELARALYRFGLSAYGKPGLRKGAGEPGGPPQPLAAL